MVKNKPIHEIKVKGIRAAIWENESKKSNAWFNVTISRLFKKGGQWRDTASFRCDDLPVVSKVVEMAYDWILKTLLSTESERYEE